jgi:hypothetical protein
MADKPNVPEVPKSAIEIAAAQFAAERGFGLADADQLISAVINTLNKNGWAVIAPKRGDADPNRFHCPHCSAERPRFGFNFQAADLGLVGRTEYVVVYCYECRKILIPMILSYVPGPAMRAPGGRSPLEI